MVRNPEFLEHLKIVEKILNEARMHEKLIKYKNYPEIHQRVNQETVGLTR